MDIKAEVIAAAARMGVPATAVRAIYHMTDDVDELPWIVEVTMTKTSRKGARPIRVQPQGYGATIQEATEGCMRGIADYQTFGYQLAGSAAPDAF